VGVLSVEFFPLFTQIFGKSLIESEATIGRNATFFESLAFDKDLGGTRGIDFVLKTYNLDAIVLPAPQPGYTPVPAGPILFSLMTRCLNGFFHSDCRVPHRHR